MSVDLNEFWKKALSEIELQVSKGNFVTWFKNSELLEKKDGVALISFPSNFAKEWVENKYHKVVFGTLRNLDDTTKKVEFIVQNSKTAQLLAAAKAVKPIPQEASSQEGQLIFSELKVDPETNLNPKYTLGSFVVGSSNEMSYAAVMAILKEVGRKYNPLFIYGGVGVGKTHLIQGLGNEIKKLYQNKVKVKYVPSEKFTNEVISALRNKRMETVKDQYRSVDVLIIDDIQFIGGKTRTEEEFFHTFNALYENNKQIIISSDRSPNYIPTLQERLRSRFEGGMICDIGYPDYELRVAVLKNKLQEKGINMPQEVIDQIATRVKKNLRELEGALNRVLFYQQTKNQPVTTKIVDQVINENSHDPIGQINHNDIISAVADFYDVSAMDITGRCRKKEVVEPRQIAMYLLRDVLDLSFPYIGEKLGKRDHTTAMYSYDKISQEINKNSGLNQKILMIKEKLVKS